MGTTEYVVCNIEKLVSHLFIQSCLGLRKAITFIKYGTFQPHRL